ncbi:MAG: XRE family transcriptional regulator [Clostridia bacterium]|nr:XRE family transcriptional regulator [Clostridia bacterium]
MVDVMQIGAKIKRLRKDRGLTQQAFADELNVSFQAVSNWERGITPPDLDNIVQIASFFGILVDELLCPSDEELVLGIDGGGTKTAFALTTLDGRVLRSFTREASNPNSVGVQTTFNILSGGIAEIINTYPSVSSIFCGIAGVASGGCIDYLTDELTKRFQNKKIVIKSDYENIFSLDDDADIAIISGTGSVVCIRQDGENTLIGGWGYIFDKAGSAFDIGRDAICTALEEETFGAESSAISELIKKDLNVSCIRSVLGSVYSRDKSYVASFAKFVFEAYEKGDKKAEEIIDESAKRLAQLLNVAVARYGAKPKAISGGGLFEHYGDIMLGHISKYTSVEIIIPSCPPLYGACKQARLLSDGNIPSNYYANFMESYKEIVK